MTCSITDLVKADAHGVDLVGGVSTVVEVAAGGGDDDRGEGQQVPQRDVVGGVGVIRLILLGAVVAQADLVLLIQPRLVEGTGAGVDDPAVEPQASMPPRTRGWGCRRGARSSGPGTDAGRPGSARRRPSRRPAAPVPRRRPASVASSDSVRPTAATSSVKLVDGERGRGGVGPVAVARECARDGATRRRWSGARSCGSAFVGWVSVNRCGGRGRP